MAIIFFYLVEKKKSFDSKILGSFINNLEKGFLVVSVCMTLLSDPVSLSSLRFETQIKFNNRAVLPD